MSKTPSDRPLERWCPSNSRNGRPARASRTPIGSFVRTDGSDHPFVDIALTRCQFETIHPYGGGNGRLGRLLITLRSYDQGYPEQPTLSQEYFNRYEETETDVDRMDAVRKHGEWGAWIDFFVIGIRYQAGETLLRSRELYELQREYGGDAAYARLACALFERPHLTTAVVEELVDVIGPAAYRAIDRLAAAGFLEETTGKERNREHRTGETFGILERTEPHLERYVLPAISDSQPTQPGDEIGLHGALAPYATRSLPAATGSVVGGTDRSECATAVTRDGGDAALYFSRIVCYRTDSNVWCRMPVAHRSIGRVSSGIQTL